MRIMITGGGTGGHTSPALAVIEELQRRDPMLVLQWVGRRGNIEERLCRDRAIPFRGLPVEGWPRKRGLRQAWVGLKLAWCMMRAWMLLRRFQPQVVFGVGGYVALPIGYMAQRMGIPTVLHEQNQLLGMTNRILAPKATRLYLSYPETRGAYPEDRAEVVGNPVRAGFITPPSREAAREALDFDPTIPVVLVVGGSQGAHRLNAAMIAVVRELGEREAQVLWMTGQADAAEARSAAGQSAARVEVFAFIDDMPQAFAAADLVVSRAGASSTAEIAAMGRPSILVPYPHATDNHQEENARAFEERHAAVVLLDHDCTGERLVLLLRELLGDPKHLETMGHAAASLAVPAAAERIVEGILALVFEAAQQAEETVHL